MLKYELNKKIRQAYSGVFGFLGLVFMASQKLIGNGTFLYSTPPQGFSRSMLPQMSCRVARRSLQKLGRHFKNWGDLLCAVVVFKENQRGKITITLPETNIFRT